ncbi:MAG: hypothetical protein JNN03_19475 [Rubrivivax sp.]|nr:hypothetical protein [Rubrivivax sp.]
MREPAPVAFEVLFKTRGSGAVPTAATREAFRPSPQTVQATLGWLQSQGVSCHDTGFSLACSAPADRFAALFGDARRPRVPPALAPWVESINLPPTPDLF